MSMLGLGAAVALAAAIRGLVLEPLTERYRLWRDDPCRIQTARRNWRGVYVPDLTIKRLRLLFLLFLFGTPLAGAAFGYWLIG